MIEGESVDKLEKENEEKASNVGWTQAMKE